MILSGCHVLDCVFMQDSPSADDDVAAADSDTTALQEAPNFGEEEQTHKSWIDHLRQVLAPHFDEAQLRDVVVESGCSGTGCPTWAMQVRVGG